MMEEATSQRGLFLRSLASVFVIVVIWEAAARAGLAPALFLPPFTKVIAEWWSVCADGSLPVDLGISLSRAAVGLSLATTIGVPLGIAMARSRLLHWLFDPVIALAFPSPKDRVPADLHSLVRHLQPVENPAGGVRLRVSDSDRQFRGGVQRQPGPDLVGGLNGNFKCRSAVSHRAAGGMAADFRRFTCGLAGGPDHDLHGRDGLWRWRHGRNADVFATLLRKSDRIRLYSDHARSWVVARFCHAQGASGVGVVAAGLIVAVCRIFQEFSHVRFPRRLSLSGFARRCRRRRSP